ncbi:hypothetical protein [Bifidobacterium apri]|uniref:Uncharacterized protein n=1 Tax=Bifidobacterium apri TaxID=1769423 RepID=A0A6A2VDN2_9BIFI|nr:hypothetical protein [Bifidobacterium apri]KAB8296531.1 hypothetical protein DSM100238_1422 [Bifidobacterium apri]
MEEAEFEAFMQRLDQLSARRKLMQTQLAERKRQLDENIAKQKKENEQRRRNGEDGRAWQVLQQRIDMGKTCEQDILCGIDKSPEAREVRSYISKFAGQMRDYVEDTDDPDNEAAQARIVLDEQLERLHDQEARFNATE